MRIHKRLIDLHSPSEIVKQITCTFLLHMHTQHEFGRMPACVLCTCISRMQMHISVVCTAREDLPMTAIPVASCCLVAILATLFLQVIFPLRSISIEPGVEVEVTIQDVN